jgi:sulfatase modifying factor 1
MTAMGTSAWMAPEQADAKHVDGAADRYAFGLLSYALLAGRMPWGSEATELSVLLSKVQGKLEPLSVTKPGVGAVASAAVMSMLSLSPSDRPSSCSAFLERLTAKSTVAPAVPASPAKPPEVLWKYAGPEGSSRELGQGELVRVIVASPRGRHLVWRPGMSEWQSWEMISELSAAVSAALRSVAPPPLPPPSRKAGDLRTVTGQGRSAFSFDVVYVPPGEFEMGSPPTEEGRFGDETQHRVRLTRGFELGVFPVTQALYAAVMGVNPSSFKGDQLPVENVSWFDAVRLCNAVSRACGLPEAYSIGPGGEPTVSWSWSSVGFRLPTESEWEYAARSGTRHVYAGGDDRAAVGWFEDNSGGSTHPVGQKRSNAWGLHDMSGNVFEWCWDGYGDYPKGVSTDPTGGAPASGSDRVGRGGSWFVGPLFARVAYRGSNAPGGRGSGLGVRLLRTVT